MSHAGGCYCGAIRYEFNDEPALNGQCHCRECQYFSGGSPNVIIGVPEANFRYTKGTPESFKRSDLDKPVTREFCPQCGTPLLSRAPTVPGVVLIKRGTLDDPAPFKDPEFAIYTAEKYNWHSLPQGIQAFEHSFPG